MTERDAELELVTRGRDAGRRLREGGKTTWADWCAVGLALEVGRSVSGAHGSNQPHRGRGFNKVFGKWLEENELSWIDKGTRSRLDNCMKYRAAIEQWRGTLSYSDLVQFNHPNSVWRKWQAHVADKGKPGKASARPSTADQLKAEVVRLEEEVTRLKANGGDLFSQKDSAKDIAKAIFGTLGETKLKAVTAELLTLQEMQKDEAAKIAADAKAEARKRVLRN